MKNYIFIKMWYNLINGADFKLDVGLYRLNLQVACQRYRHTRIDAKSTLSERFVALVNSAKTVFRTQPFALAA